MTDAQRGDFVPTRAELAEALTLAYIDGLHRRPVPPPAAPADPPRLDGTGRHPLVPLRSARG